MALDGQFLAGLVAGGGCFAISQKNAGQSWCCGFRLCQREDSADLVMGARDFAGCGELRWIPPRGTSHAQVAWVVQSMDGCLTLAAALHGRHLLGKKAGDLAVWRRAVAAWSDGALGALRWTLLERFASALRAHRHVGLVPDYTRVDISSAALSSFLAGFATAEGHFGASSNGHPRFALKLRADDTALLNLLAHRFEVGRLVHVSASKHGHAQTAWLVTRLDELRRLVPVFDRHEPLGRAGRIYPHWRQLVMASDRRHTVLRPSVGRIRET